jgi:hypothetical protein
MSVTRSFKTAFILFNSPIISEFGFLSKYITDLFVGYKRQIIMTTENDPVLIQSTSQLAEKYPDNTTI